MSQLALRRFGDQILRKKAQRLSLEEIKRDEIQTLLTDMKNTIQAKSMGVGLAAPQVGYSTAVAVIDIKPTELRPNVEPYSAVIINPAYKGLGRRAAAWEGCLSTGLGDQTLFAKAARYEKIEAEWFDEKGKRHLKQLSGLPAQVFQHETDHINGVLFVDHVEDTSTYTMGDEYRKRLAT